jgi:hypothetical protein
MKLLNAKSRLPNANSVNIASGPFYVPNRSISRNNELYMLDLIHAPFVSNADSFAIN